MVAGVSVIAGTPVPVREAVREVATAFTVRVPVRVPTAVGVRTMLIWQLAPAATAVQLLLTMLKSPVAERDETDCGADALFVQVNVWTEPLKPTGAKPKSIVDGVSPAPGAPVPVSADVRVVPFETTVRVPVRAPSTVGENTTLMAQLVPPGTPMQLLPWTAKSPLAVRPVTDAAKVELFVQVNV